MSTGGLTGAGGGSLAGTTPPPLQNQPRSAPPGSYAQASSSRPDASKREGIGAKADGDARVAQNGDGWGQTEEQSQKLQEFDAVKGRPNLGDERQGGGEKGEQKGSFVDCAAGAAKDVVVGTAKGAYKTVKDAGGVVLDAGGAALDKAGVDGFEGHTERTAERVDAVKDGAAKVWEAAKSPIETGGKIYEAGRDGIVETYESGRDELVEIGTEIKNGESCKLGERVGTTVGVGGMVVVGGGVVIGGAKLGSKVLTKIGGRDGPEAKPETKDAEKTEQETDTDGNDTAKRVIDGGVEYKVTTDRTDWGETRREVGTLDESRARRQNDESKDGGKKYEATTLENLEKHGVDISTRGADLDDMGRTEMRLPPRENVKLGEVDLETKNHVIEIHSGRGGKRAQIQDALNAPQLNRGKDVILYSPHYSRQGTELINGKEVLKDAVGPNGERAQVVRDAGELAEIIKSSK